MNNKFISILIAIQVVSLMLLFIDSGYAFLCMLFSLFLLMIYRKVKEDQYENGR